MKMQFNIEKRKSLDMEIVNKLKADKLPVVILGKGNFSNFVCTFLNKVGIMNLTFTSTIDWEGCLTPKELDEKYEAYNLVLGFQKYIPENDDFFKVFKNRHGVFQFSIGGTMFPISYDFYSLNRDKFLSTYEKFADDKSRMVMEVYLQSKIYCDDSLMQKVFDTSEEPQYFGVNLYKISNNEIFVDCGAYDGDTCRAFIKYVDNKFKKIFAFEPDKSNYEKLSTYFAHMGGVTEVECIQAATSNENKTLRFSAMGNTSSSIDEHGEIEIQAVKIDDVVENTGASFIKMDIEGSELDALHGAENTIKKFRPILAICAYHKPEDLFSLYDYINSICKDYKFFLRAHKPFPQEVVMYAIPNERVKHI